MANVIIKLPGTDLGSRFAAVEQRLRIASNIAAGKKVVVDLTDVLSISDSYADELFGVLALEHGLNWILDHISFANATDHVLHAIATPIDRRIKERERALHARSA